MWDKTTTDLKGGVITHKFSHEFGTNQGENGDYHWWVETPDKKIIDNTPLREYDTFDRFTNGISGIDYKRPVYFEWTDPELVSKMEKMMKEHLSQFAEWNKLTPEESLDAIDDIWRSREFKSGCCDLNASATHRNIPGSRLCVGTFGHRCGGNNKGTICVSFGM